MIEPPWLEEAHKYLGLKEIPGVRNEPLILKMWRLIGIFGVADDETPWCAAFVGSMLETVGIKSTKSGLAKSYLDWGVKLEFPIIGCIVVFDRKGGGGHVGFAVGKDKDGNLMVLGGNQGNMVSIKAFPPKRVPLGYFWPKEYPMSNFYGNLPIIDGEQVSDSEA